MKKRVLIVDDEVSFTRLLKLNLEQTNLYEVRVVNWAEDTLQVAQEFRPEVVLLDVIMPRMFGGDVAAQLQSDADLANTPILFFTAALSKRRIEQHDGGIISGFPFLAKPASVKEIIVQIERLAAHQNIPADNQALNGAETRDRQGRPNRPSNFEPLGRQEATIC